MWYQLEFVAAARQAFEGLDDPRRRGKVQQTLGLLQTNPRHPGLASHQYENFPGNPKAKVWESYVENATPGAWRIFWMYGPDREGPPGKRIPVITILAITSHP